MAGYTPAMHAEKAMNLAIEIFSLATETDVSPGSRLGIAMSIFRHEDSRVVGSALQFTASLLTQFLTVEQVIEFKNDVMEELERRNG